MFGIEFREALAIIYCFTDDEHRGKGEMIVMNDLCEVFELASIDFLIGPCEMITGCDGCIFWIFLKEFALDIIDYRR